MLLGLPLVPSNKNYLVRDNGQSAPTGEWGWSDE